MLDLCTGTGALAVAAARAGADVTAVDVSRRAVLNAHLNARLQGVRIRAIVGDLWEPVRGRRFDVIVSNPPYLPAAGAAPRGSARGWDAGVDGRAILDPLCRRAREHLRPGGRLLLIHSSVARPDVTEEALATTGLRTRLVDAHEGPLGPLLAARARFLGLPADSTETLVVIEGRLPG